MKKIEDIKVGYAPVYAALYPAFAKLFQKNGYALAIHGSLQRDFDMIAIPWADKVSTPRKVINQILKEFAVREVGKPTKRNYGRVAYTVSIEHGACALDLSFFPKLLSPRKVGGKDE